MSKELLETDIKREVGKLYFCKTNRKGCLTICEAQMKHGKNNHSRTKLEKATSKAE